MRNCRNDFPFHFRSRKFPILMANFLFLKGRRTKTDANHNLIINPSRYWMGDIAICSRWFYTRKYNRWDNFLQIWVHLALLTNTNAENHSQSIEWNHAFTFAFQSCNQCWIFKYSCCCLFVPLSPRLFLFNLNIPGFATKFYFILFLFHQFRSSIHSRIQFVIVVVVSDDLMLRFVSTDAVASFFCILKLLNWSSN